jgi:hypothetical protein
MTHVVPRPWPRLSVTGVLWGHPPTSGLAIETAGRSLVGSNPTLSANTRFAAAGQRRTSGSRAPVAGSAKPMDDRASGAGLDDRQDATSVRLSGRCEAGGHALEAGDGIRTQPVPDVRATPLAGHPTGLAQHLEVVADGRLRDVAAGHEVAGAHGVAARELSQDRETRRIRRTLEQERVGIGHLPHAGMVLTDTYIVKYQYRMRSG